MNNQKSAFVSSPSKYMSDNGFRSVFTTWPNLFPAYTISYSAATGKPIENGKKKLFVLLVLLLLLITSLAASLILAFLWFNAIQTEFAHESIKVNAANQAAFDSPDGLQSPNNHHHQINHHKLNHPINTHLNHHSNNQINLNSRSPTSTTRSTSTTPQSTTAIETEPTNEDDGFGESDNGPPNAQPPSSSDEHLINYYKNMKNELDRHRPNKIRHEEKLDGDFVEHHTISDVPDDGPGELTVLQPEQPATSSSSGNQNEPNLMLTEDYSHAQSTLEQNPLLPEQLSALRAKQFCNLNAYFATPKNSSYECRSNLNPGRISSYFCNDKFVIVAKINALRETVINEQSDLNERQLISKYDVHIERILKRSPFISVAFKKQGLTTNVTIDLAVLADELRNSESKTLTCLGQRLELKMGQTYLLSGHIHGLSAVSDNCDLQLGK